MHYNYIIHDQQRTSMEFDRFDKNLKFDTLDSLPSYIEILCSCSQKYSHSKSNGCGQQSAGWISVELNSSGLLWSSKPCICLWIGLLQTKHIFLAGSTLPISRINITRLSPYHQLKQERATSTTFIRVTEGPQDLQCIKANQAYCLHAHWRIFWHLL